MNILENQLVPKTEEILSLLLKMAHRVETFKEPETEDLKHSAIVAINDILNIDLNLRTSSTPTNQPRSGVNKSAVDPT